MLIWGTHQDAEADEDSAADKADNCVLKVPCGRQDIAKGLVAGLVDRLAVHLLTIQNLYHTLFFLFPILSAQSAACTSTGV